LFEDRVFAFRCGYEGNGNHFERKVLTINDVLSEVGGLLGSLDFIFMMLFSPIASSYFKDKMIAKLFYAKTSD
jgi:hypothetical protein